MFGSAGQAKLADFNVAVIGLGGIGSLVVEYLAILGVGHFVLIDDDCVEVLIFHELWKAFFLSDAQQKIAKVKVARRLISEQ